MSNVANILDARRNKNLQVFNERLDKIWRSTIANADRSDPRVSHVLDSLFDILKSKAETQESLVQKHKTASDEERVAIEKQLDAGPLLAIEAFVEKIKSTCDLDDPVALTAFEAAGRYLVQFLQLENDYICNSLDMLITHVQLRSDRQPPKSRRRSRSKQKSPQEAEGAR
jgi:hypothetical protein